MTREKMLERKILKIASACNVACLSGLALLLLALVSAAMDILADAPFDGVTIGLLAAGIAATVPGLAIGSIIDR